ncbi:MAG: hypothetical protein ACTTG8_01660 [Catonella sp.]|uniref:hypothetical protein n=1 Tax=Catonella sp. TaxID=2382125 RepID=UPI003FA0B5FF
MKIEEFMKSELCARILMKDKDVGLDNQDLETLFRDKEEVSAFTGIADGERNVQLAVEAVLENIKFNGKEKKFERAILMIEGDLTMQDVSEGLDIMREEMVTSDADLIFGSKYVENSEKRVRVDAIMV